MDNACGRRNSGPVALTPPPMMALKTKPVQRSVVEAAGGLACGQSVAVSGVQLVCTNPGCTVAPWMDAGDWEARVTSAQQEHRQRGWNGDEDDWRPDHVGSSSAFPEQLACPCGRGWRRRATMPSTSSPEAVAARLDRLQQLRIMRRSEPMLAAGSGTGSSHVSAGWPDACKWPGTLSFADGGLWTSRPSMVRPHLGFCLQTIGTERFRPENPVSISRHRVFSEPEIYDSINPCVTGGTNGYVYSGNVYHSQLVNPSNGYKLPSTQLAHPSSTLDYCNDDHLAAGLSQNRQLNSADVLQGHQRGQIYSGQQSERRRNIVDVTAAKRPNSKSDAMSWTETSGTGSRRLADRQAGSSRRDRASPDSMSSDSGSSAGSTGSATGRRKHPTTEATGPLAAGRASTACCRGNIFRLRTQAELAVFRSLSLHCNAYEVQTAGDDAPYGKDRLRTHVLVALSAARRSTVDCVICSTEMVVYQDFPLLDGLFFESPKRYNSDVRVEALTVGGLHRQPLSDASKFYLNAVCFKCLHVNNNSAVRKDIYLNVNYLLYISKFL